MKVLKKYTGELPAYIVIGTHYYADGFCEFYFQAKFEDGLELDVVTADETAARQLQDEIEAEGMMLNGKTRELTVYRRPDMPELSIPEYLR